VVNTLIENNTSLKKQIEGFQREKAQELKNTLKTKAENINGITFIAEQVEVDTASIKDIVFSLKNEIEKLFVVLGNVSEGKVSITLMISDDLVEANKWNASKIIRDFAKEIQGGGGGQDFYATAGGKNPAGLPNVFSKAREFVSITPGKQ